MNIDILDPKEAMEYLNMLQAQGFGVEHRIPTRDHSCLDHVMVRSNCIQTKVRVDEIPRITDHAIVDMQVSLTSGHQFLNVLDTSPAKKRVDENKFMKIFRGFN